MWRATKTMLGAIGLLLTAAMVVSGVSGMEGGGNAPSIEARRPITYFNTSCANCHGDYGSFWGEGFAANLSDEELHEVVEEMAVGPAQAPLDEKALAVQTAYHRSLVDGRPFIVAWREKGVWTGEVTPKATITSEGGTAKVEGHRWTMPGEATVLKVKLGDATTELSLDEKGQSKQVWHSHAAPATQPTTQPAQD